MESSTLNHGELVTEVAITTPQTSSRRKRVSEGPPPLTPWKRMKLANEELIKERDALKKERDSVRKELQELKSKAEEQKKQIQYLERTCEAYENRLGVKNFMDHFKSAVPIPPLARAVEIE